MPRPDRFDRRTLAEIAADDFFAKHALAPGGNEYREAVDNYGMAFAAVEDSGGLVFDRWEVDALRRSLEWVQTVIAATASTDADKRYLETLGLLGRIGEPESRQQAE
jgi:hypothetical protein